MQFCDIPLNKRTLHVVPWSDPVVDQVGYDPRTLYVEQFWLGILGPPSLPNIRRPMWQVKR